MPLSWHTYVATHPFPTEEPFHDYLVQSSYNAVILFAGLTLVVFQHTFYDTLYCWNVTNNDSKSIAYLFMLCTCEFVNICMDDRRDLIDIVTPLVEGLLSASPWEPECFITMPLLSEYRCVIIIRQSPQKLIVVNTKSLAIYPIIILDTQCGHPPIPL